jgi:hypothetical protein
MRNFFELDFPLLADSRLSALCREMGIATFAELIAYLRGLPYGRISNKKKPELVLQQGRGTVSSKHALLIQLACENRINDLKLALCTYPMAAKTHPEAAAVLSDYGLACIPEARCLVKYDNRLFNLMRKEEEPLPEITSEIEIAPQQIANFKKRYHRKFIQSWLQIERLHKQWNTDQIWSVREECIEAAEQNWPSDARLLRCA